VNDAGVCRPSCDPNLALLNGRVREVPSGTIVTDGDPNAFSNPFFRFAIEQGFGLPNEKAKTEVSLTSRADMQFKFTTQGGFRPLVMSMVIDEGAVVPTAAQFLSPTGELVISDGSLTGITFIDLNVLAISRQYK